MNKAAASILFRDIKMGVRRYGSVLIYLIQKIEYMELCDGLGLEGPMKLGCQV